MKAPRLLLAATVSFAISGPVHAQFATIDVAAIAQMVEQVAALEEQLRQQQDMVRNMTEGLTGLGDEFFRGLNSSMPDSWEDVLDAGQRGRPVLEDRERELSDMPPREASRVIRERQREQQAAQLAMLQEVYDKNQRQLDEMRQLSARIETADTQRQVQDLQARIQASQGAVEANNMRLNNMTMLRQAEQDLLEEESYEAFHRRATGDGQESRLRLVR